MNCSDCRYLENENLELKVELVKAKTEAQYWKALYQDILEQLKEVEQYE